MLILKTVEVIEIVGKKVLLKNTHSETVRVSRLRREKSQRNENSEGARDFKCNSRWRALKHCSALNFLYPYSERKEFCNILLYFRIFCKLFHSRNKVLCDLL